MYTYTVLCLLVGVHTEEARALRRDHVDLDGKPHARPTLPPSMAVWRSMQAHGDTKTDMSRRTFGLPKTAVEALRELREAQATEGDAAGELWQDLGLVLSTSIGTPLSSGHVRRMFKDMCRHADIGEEWTPGELRTSFVSLLSGELSACVSAQRDCTSPPRQKLGAGQARNAPWRAPNPGS